MTTHVLHRQLGRSWPIAVSGSGCTLTDSEGRTYLDASGGAAVSCLGHGHPDVIAAMHAQIDRLAYAHTSFFTTEVAEALADDLIAHAPAGMSHAYFVSGGSEGDRGRAEDGAPVLRRDAASRSGATSSRAGRAITATRWARSSVGGNEWRRAPVRAAADRRDARRRRATRTATSEHGETPEALRPRALADELDAAIERLGGDAGDRVHRRDGGRRHRRAR